MAEAAVAEQDIEQIAAKVKGGDVSMFTADSTDETAAASSAAEESAESKPEEAKKPAEEKSDETDESKLQAKIKALEKELARRTDRREAQEASIEALKEQVAKLQGQLEERERSEKARSGTKSVKDFTEEQLIGLETDWEEVLADAKAAGQAEQVERAKANIKAIKAELHLRAKEAGAKKSQEATEEEHLKEQVKAAYEDAYTAFPELKDKESELWKAAQEQYVKLPKRFQEAGVVGDMMAVVKAIAKNPKLLGQREVKARADVLNNLEKAADKALQTGASATNIKPIPNFAELPPDDINAMAERLKAGGSLIP